ncbi:MAG: hypothetical protein P4L75_00060 [Clostridia bacterium]|nr:hypothetical protein [Clostridia bacterium]
MNTQEIALIIIAICAGAIFGACVFAVVAVKRGWKTSSVLETADGALNIADTVSMAIAPLLPPQVSTVTQKIIEYAKTAVSGAEQLYKIGTLTGDQRKQQAVDFVVSALKADKVDVTAEMQSMIGFAVEAAVNAASLVKIPVQTTTATAS